jgi:hypothetical protein
MQQKKNLFAIILKFEKLKDEKYFEYVKIMV